MEQTSWFEREEDWVLKRSIIFNRKIVQFTFLEVNRLIKLVGELNSNSRILDLCCGIGRHSIELARKGFAVTGVDITRSYLEIAAEKAAGEKLEIEFVQSDMRQFIRTGAFDLVVNLCTSFGYFDDMADDIQVLKNIYDSLVPGGRFLIEIWGKEVIAARFNPLEEKEYDDCKMIAHSKILNDWNLLECKRTIIKGDATEEIVARHRLYSATELKAHLVATGFKNIRIYGSFSGAPYDNKAKSMIMIGEK